LPVITPGIRSAFAIDGKADPPPGQPPLLANNRVVSSGYFRALGIPLINGRSLSNQDTAQAPFAAVINQAMAKRYWGDESPVGKRFRLLSHTGTPPWINVVGVAGDIHQGGLDVLPLPEFYTPLTQETRSICPATRTPGPYRRRSNERGRGREGSNPGGG